MHIYAPTMQAAANTGFMVWSRAWSHFYYSLRCYAQAYVECYSYYYLLTAWSRVLLQKLNGSQLFKKFP